MTHEAGEVVWENSWSSFGSSFDPISMLGAVAAGEESFSSSAIVGASTLGFTVLAAIYLTKSKKSVSDDFQRA